MTSLLSDTQWNLHVCLLEANTVLNSLFASHHCHSSVDPTVLKQTKKLSQPAHFTR